MWLLPLRPADLSQIFVYASSGASRHLRDERSRSIFNEDMMSALVNAELSLYVSVLIKGTDDAKVKLLKDHAATTCNGVAGEVLEFWNQLKDHNIDEVGLCSC